MSEWDSKHVNIFFGQQLYVLAHLTRCQIAQVRILSTDLPLTLHFLHHATTPHMHPSHRSWLKFQAMPHWLNNPWTSWAMSQSSSGWKGVGDLVKTSYHKPIIHPDKPWTNNPYSSPVLSKAITQREKFSWRQFNERQLHNAWADISKTAFPPTETCSSAPPLPPSLSTAC